MWDNERSIFLKTYTKTNIETRYPRKTPALPSSLQIFDSNLIADIFPSVPFCCLDFNTSEIVQSAPLAASAAIPEIAKTGTCCKSVGFESPLNS